MYFAYIHCKPDGTPFYVGKGNSRRVGEIRRNNKFHRDVCSKYGEENILVGKIECSSESIAFDLERGLIKCLRRMSVNLANVTDGGEGSSGWKAPDSYREKRRMMSIGSNNPFFGKTHSEELRKNESIRAREQWKNPELLSKASELGKLRVGPANPFYGKRHSAEAKRKNAESKLGKPGRKVSEAEREEMSIRISGERHHFFGKKLSQDHRKKLSVSAKKQATGGRFMLDTSGKLRRVVAGDIELRLSQGWTYTRKEQSCSTTS